MEIASRRWISGRWVIGSSLIAVGILFLLMNVGVIDKIPIWRWWQYWPVILMVIGINKFVQPYNRAEGFWLFAVGAWLLVWWLNLWGLGFHETWPALLIAIGIYWMWGALERDARKKYFAQQTETTSTM